MLRKLALPVLLWGTLAIGPGALAAEARIPVYGPVTLSQPGHYVVTRDLTFSGGEQLVIDVDGVTLDLNGHTLRSSTSGLALILLTGSAGDVEGVAVRNGRLSDGVTGIHADASARRRIRLERLVISDMTSRGIHLESVDQLEVTRCQVMNVQHEGLYASGNGASFSGKLSDNVIEDTPQTGVRLVGLRGGILRNNLIARAGDGTSGQAGIHLEDDTAFKSGGNLILDNTVREVDGHGIQVDYENEYNLLLRNVSTMNTDDGIRVLSPGNRLANNTANDNSGSGIYVSLGGNNLIEDNTLGDNSDYGLVCSLSVGSAWRGNMIRGNGTGAISVTTCGTAQNDFGGNITP